MGIDDFFSFISGDTVFNENNSIIKKYNGKCETDEIYFDYNSIAYGISETIEKNINCVIWDCIKKNITEESENLIKKYNITIPYIDSDNIDYTKLLEIIKTIDLSNYGLNMALDYIFNICETFTENNKLKYIYISTDGIPNMGKIYEQQKRKYKKVIDNKMNKLIYNDFEHTLSKERKQYESMKYNYYKDVLIPQQDKPGNIFEKLNSEEYFDKLKTCFPNLSKIEVNPRDFPGEGEKKIMEKIVEKNTKCKYLIYSPDADVILISIILNSLIEGSEFNVIRKNKLLQTYELININIIIDNIFNKISSLINNKVINKVNMIRDVSCIMSLFGNDFIPKIYTINIKIHNKLLFEAYSQILEKSIDKDGNLNYLVLFENNKYELNWEFLITYFNKLTESEHYLYSDLYIKNNYNVNHIVPYMIKPTLSETIHIFVKAINTYIFTDIKRYQHSSLAMKEKIIQRTLNNLHIFFSKNTDNTLKFLKFFIASHNLYNDNFRNYEKQSNITPINTKLSIYLKFIFDNFDTSKIYHLLKLKHVGIDFNSEYILNKIRSKFPQDDFEITEYDIELYKLYCKIKPYNTIYNSEKSNNLTNNIGRIIINYRITGNNGNVPIYYIIQSSAIQNSNDYIDYCLKINKKNTKHTMEKLSLTQDYITGFYWIMNYHFNRNCSSENIKYVSSWAYSHLYPPSLHMIQEYFIELKKTIDKKLSREISHYHYHNSKYDVVTLYMKELSKDIFSLEKGIIYVEQKNFIDSIERIMLINPVTNNEIEYNKNKLCDKYMLLRKNKNIFQNIDDIINEMYIAIKNKLSYDKTIIFPRLSLNKYIELLLYYNPERNLST
jgi:hypothetical protein